MKRFILLLLFATSAYGQHSYNDQPGHTVTYIDPSDSTLYITPTAHTSGLQPTITTGTTSQYLRGDLSLGTLNQAAVAGLTTASSPTFVTVTANLTGNASGSSGSCTGNAATVTTNANMTGDVTSVGNATTIGAGKVTYTMFASSAGATSATTGTIAVTMTQSVFTITPTGACTFNASGGVAGNRCTFIVTTSGTSAFVLTFGTNFKTTGTLSTGTVTAKVFTVSFVCKNGTEWDETSRTTAM